VANYELFKKIQSNENNAVGEVMMDNGQGEQEETEKVEQRKELDGKQSESKCKDARAEQQKSKQYVELRRQQNKKKVMSKQERNKNWPSLDPPSLK
jgi:hypothetical protein